MSEFIWINPIVKGSCDPFGDCGGSCCKVKVFKPGNVEYTLSWCEHFDETVRRCKIYKTRPEGCRTYPTVKNLTLHPTYPGCGYYLEESN